MGALTAKPGETAQTLSPAALNMAPALTFPVPRSVVSTYAVGGGGVSSTIPYHHNIPFQHGTRNTGRWGGNGESDSYVPCQLMVNVCVCVKYIEFLVVRVARVRAW